MTRKQLLAPMIAGLFLALLMGCHPTQNQAADVAVTRDAVPFPGGKVACPDHSGLVGWVNHDSGTVTMLALAGPTTLIPEFNDCQRLIDTKHHYGTLAAIWAPTAYNGHLMDSVATGRAVAAAVILAWDGDYTPLGIKQKWNCLYLGVERSTRALKGWMVSTGGAPDCAGTRDFKSMDSATPLEVHREEFKGLGDADYPDVGRWDRDEDRASPYDYIGLKCGAAWCDIYRAKSDPFIPSEHYSLGSSTTSPWQRVYKAKGWYDEQYLDLGSNSSKRPLSVMGTIIPDHELGIRTMTDFRGNWVIAGSVALSSAAPKYLKTYGLEPGVLPHGSNETIQNIVALCWTGPTEQDVCAGIPDTLPATCNWDPSADKGKKWYSQTHAPSGLETYKCVNRHDHSGIEVSGTARWQWLEADATQWYRCDKGCCSIKP